MRAIILSTLLILNFIINGFAQQPEVDNKKQAGSNKPYSKGLELYNQHRYPEALAAYKEALATNPDNANLHFFLAEDYFILKQFSEAAAEYRKAIELKPD